ncbi:hypothetical protein PTKIN_Ptkin10aG0008000 [Pterospermum kingtungense]
MDVEVVRHDKALPSPMFEIEVKGTFVIVDSVGGGGEIYTEAGRIISEVIHEFPLEDIIDDANGAVLDMLNSMRLPVQPAVVEEIAATSFRMAVAARDGRDSEVLRMQVEIEAVVDHVPDFGDNDTDDDDDSEDEGVVVTAEEVAENVGKVVVVEASGTDCPICLEELAMGSDAACMPCSHVFHDLCISTWLSKKKRCPCCRFKLTKLN